MAIVVLAFVRTSTACVIISVSIVSLVRAGVTLFADMPPTSPPPCDDDDDDDNDDEE